MSRGELSFSKVRAITRLVDDLSDPEKPDAEAELVDVARQVTAASLEKIVRGWGVLSGLDETELERRRHRSRYLSVAPDGEGMYVVRGKLDPEVGALLMRALDAAGDALFRDGEDWAPVGGTRGPRAEEISPRQRRADAAGLLCERAMAMGFGRGVEDADGAHQDGAVQDTDTTPRDAPISGTKAERYQVVLHVDMDTLTGEDESDHSPDASGGRSHLEDGTRVSAETSRRLCCDAAVVKVTRGPDGSVLDVGRKTRTIPPAIRRALEVRDGGCRFPGCGLRFADGHHIIPWSLGGPTCLSNLVLLCPHHHRCVHEGGFTVRMRSDQRLRRAAPLRSSSTTAPAGHSPTPRRFPGWSRAPSHASWMRTAGTESTPNGTRRRPPGSGTPTSPGRWRPACARRWTRRSGGWLRLTRLGRAGRAAASFGSPTANALPARRSLRTGSSAGTPPAGAARARRWGTRWLAG